MILIGAETRWYAHISFMMRASMSLKFMSTYLKNGTTENRILAWRCYRSCLMIWIASMDLMEGVWMLEPFEFIWAWPWYPICISFKSESNLMILRLLAICDGLDSSYVIYG